MIKNIVNQSALDEGDQHKFRFGNDLIAYVMLNDGSKHSIQPEGGEKSIKPEFFSYLLEKAHANLEILRPQEFSSGLAKLMCLTEELFTVPVKAKGCLLNAGAIPAEVR